MILSLFQDLPISATPLSFMMDDIEYVTFNIVEADIVQNSIWNIVSIMALIYGIGVLVSLIKLSLDVLKLFKLKHQSNTSTEGKFSIISANIPSAFSCFKWVFIPINHNYGLNNSIIEHEKLHAKAWHTIDLIITELFIALLWFNPFVYLFRRDLKSIHEFQVDSMLLQTNIKKSDYLQLMLNMLTSKNRVVGLYNYFNGLTIKKRVNMITKSKSSNLQLVRYLLIVPIVLLMTMSFSDYSKTIANEAVGDSLKTDIITTSSSGDMPNISPIKEGDIIRIASGYGWRVHPIYKTKRMHSGIDFSADKGTSIMATADGVISKTEFLKDSYGKFVVINHGGGYETIYYHMNEYIVKEGDKVKEGDIIGFVGNTGRSTGPHLHYEVHKDGKAVDPKLYIDNL